MKEAIASANAERASKGLDLKKLMPLYVKKVFPALSMTVDQIGNMLPTDEPANKVAAKYTYGD